MKTQSSTYSLCNTISANDLGPQKPKKVITGKLLPSIQRVTNSIGISPARRSK